MIYKKILSFFTFLALFLIVFTGTDRVKNVKANQISAPTVIEAGSKRALEGIGYPYVLGLTQINTEVLIYIDGNYVNFAKINSENTEADNFYFEHSQSLPTGKHTIYAISRDKTSLLLSPPTEIEFIVPSLPAPTLIAPNENTITGKAKPIITGLTVSNSLVHIYIDGVPNGKTPVVKHDSGTANFSYEPFLNLKVGWHKIQAMTENLQGEKSALSEILNFKIENQMPAPTLLSLKTNLSETSKPLIEGLAKNNSTVKIFIDRRLNGQFKIKNSESGTANFSYEPFQPLTRGDHLVYATAMDDKGKESCWSNIVYFNTKNPTISESAQETRPATVAKIEEPIMAAEEPLAEIFTEEKTGEVVANKKEETADNKEKQTEAVSDNDIKNLINEKIEKGKEDSGLIDEDKTGQSKLRLNLIIFIAFLLGIIIWIFWVNKELIKERRVKQEKLSLDKDNQNKNKPF